MNLRKSVNQRFCAGLAALAIAAGLGTPASAQTALERLEALNNALAELSRATGGPQQGSAAARTRPQAQADRAGAVPAASQPPAQVADAPAPQRREIVGIAFRDTQAQAEAALKSRQFTLVHGGPCRTFEQVAAIGRPNPLDFNCSTVHQNEFERISLRYVITPRGAEVMVIEYMLANPSIDYATFVASVRERFGAPDCRHRGDYRSPSNKDAFVWSTQVRSQAGGCVVEDGEAQVMWLDASWPHYGFNGHPPTAALRFDDRTPLGQAMAQLVADRRNEEGRGVKPTF